MHVAKPEKKVELEVQIRQASTSDISALASLLAELGFSSDDTELPARLAAMPGAVLVAVVGGEVVGFLSTNIMAVLHRPKPVGRISAFVVQAAMRNRGIGKTLLQAAEHRLWQQGCGLIEITSNFKLEQAHAFYQRMGYEPTSVRLKKTSPEQS